MTRLAVGALALLLNACGIDPAPLVIENARSPAAPPGASVIAVYMDIESRSDDVLLAAHSPIAQRTQMHTTMMENDMMLMRPSPSVPLPAGRTVQFAPGGLHFMLSDLRDAPAAGASFPLRLAFRNAGEIEVQVRVLAPGEQ